MQFVLWGGAILAAILALLAVIVLLRRRSRDRREPSTVFPPSSAPEEGRGQVRLLEDNQVAHQARVDALRGEVKSLRREASYAAQRGLDRRAQRLEELIAEREEELDRHEPAAGHDRAR